MTKRGARPWLIVLGLLWGAALVAVGVAAVAAVLRPAEYPGYYSEEQARDGVLVYAQRCASCHGPDLRGGAAPPLTGDAFWARWGGQSVADLALYVHRQMPPGRQASLSREAAGASVAYILHHNALPAGGPWLLPGQERLIDLPLTREAAGSRMEPIAPTTGVQPRHLLGRLLGGGPRNALAQVEGREGATDRRGADQGDGRLQDDQQEDGPQQGDQEDRQLGQDGSEGDRTGEGEGGGRAGGPQEQGFTGEDPSARALGTGDLRLTVVPREAEVDVRGPEGTIGLRGGSRVLGELEPGLYTVVARHDGVVLEQELTVAAGEVTTAELRFASAEDEASQRGGTGDAIAGVTLDGGTIYARRCLECHGPAGGGDIGPALANNPRLQYDEWMLRRILGGGLGMPAFGGVLTPPEIAAVATFVRTHFGNDRPPIEAEQVRAVAEEMQPTQLERATGPDLALAPLGEQRYVELCSACHGLQGGGDVGPPLAGNPRLADEQLVLTTILYGRGLMPAFSQHSNREIAAIASYIRTSWSNGYGHVSAERVAVFRPSPAEADAPSEGRTDADRQ